MLFRKIPEVEGAGRNLACTGEAGDGSALPRIAFRSCQDRGGIPRRLRPATETHRAGHRVPVQAFGENERQEGGQKGGDQTCRSGAASSDARSEGGPTPEAARNGEEEPESGKRHARRSLTP